MSRKENDFVTNLITQSKTLAEANVLKHRNERIFKELTLFQNLSNFCNLDKTSNSNSEQLQKVFKVSVKVYPSPLLLDSVRVHENMVLVLENVSKTFSFSRDHWQLLLDLGSGEEISSWSLENNLDPGTKETFSKSFTTSPTISPVALRLRLLFSCDALGSSFVKVIPLYEGYIDILHLLTPVRVPRPVEDCGSVFPLASFPATSSSIQPKRSQPPAQDDDSDEELPSVTQFFFRLCPNICPVFVSQFLLRDCKSRWLSVMGETEAYRLINNSDTFSMYYLEDEITVCCKSVGMVSLKCGNPRVLVALKSGILRRLELIPNIVVTCPEDTITEKLYSCRLRLEELSRAERTGGVRDFVDIYLDLRDVSEGFKFSSDKVIKRNEDGFKEILVID